MSSNDSKLHVFDDVSKVWRKAISNASGELKCETTLDKTGLSTDTLQSVGNASLSSIDSKVTVCDTGAVAVTSSALPTGASTATLQTASNATLSSIDSKIIACNTGAVVVSNITACDTGNISGSVSVSNNTDPATATLQTAGNSSLTAIEASHYADGDAIAAIDTGILCMGRDNSNNAHPLHITQNGDLRVRISDFLTGQEVMADSLPVVISSDQSTLNVRHQEVRNLGSHENIASNISMASGTVSSSVDVSSMSVGNLFYEDTNTTSFDSVEIEASVNSGTNWFKYSVLYPSEETVGFRNARETGLRLQGITDIRIKNASITDSNTNVRCTIVGSP